MGDGRSSALAFRRRLVHDILISFMMELVSRVHLPLFRDPDSRKWPGRRHDSHPPARKGTRTMAHSPQPALDQIETDWSMIFEPAHLVLRYAQAIHRYLDAL